MAAIKPMKPGTAGLPVGDKPTATTTRTTRRLAANDSDVFSTDWPLGAGQDKCGRDDGADSLRTQPNAV